MSKDFVVRSGRDRRQSDRRESRTVDHVGHGDEDGYVFVRGLWSDQSQSVDECYGARVYAPMHPRARRLAVAFAMAVEAGMPGVTAVSVVSQWAESLFKHRAESRGGDQLLRSIWIAKLIVRGMPKEQLESCFSNILAGPAPKGVLEEAAVAVAAEAWNVDAVADDASFLAWHGAAYLLGTVDRALSPTHANAVFIECARVLAAVYRWNSK